MSDKLATIQQTAITADPYAPNTFEQAMAVAERVAKSRLCGITSPEQAFVILATGHELGLSPMQSLRGIHVIEGRPSPSADAIVAIIIRSGLAEYFREVKTDDNSSTWETQRKGCKPKQYTFTIKDAEAAGLVKPNSNWIKYRKRMLSARAKAFLGRDEYPDLLLGLYTPEEIQGEAVYIDAPSTDVVQPEPFPARAVEIAQTVTYDDPAEQLLAEIKAASADQIGALIDRVRTEYPKGHADRERLATALTIRRGEVSRAA